MAANAFASNEDFISLADFGDGNGNRGGSRQRHGQGNGYGGQSINEGPPGGYQGRGVYGSRGAGPYSTHNAHPGSGWQNGGSVSRQETSRSGGNNHHSPHGRESGGYHNDSPRSSHNTDSPSVAGSSRHPPSNIDRQAKERNAQQYHLANRIDLRPARPQVQPENQSLKRRIKWDDQGDKFDVDDMDYDSRTGRYIEPARGQGPSTPKGNRNGYGGNGNNGGGGPAYNGGYNDYNRAGPSLPTGPRNGADPPARTGARAERETRAKPKAKGKAKAEITGRGVPPLPRHAAAGKQDPFKFPWIDTCDFLGHRSAREMLNAEIRAAAIWLTPTPHEHEFRQRTFDLVRTIINNELPDARVYVFGSQESGLYIPGGDLDIVVDDSMKLSRDIVPNAHDRVRHSVHTTAGMTSAELQTFRNKHANGNAVLRRIKSALEKAGVARRIEHVMHARVPVLKLVAEGSRIQVDISFSALNGLETVEVVDRFLRAWPALRPLILVVKAWLTGMGWNEVRFGGLNSYSVICMWIHRFQVDDRIREQRVDANDLLYDLLVDFFGYFSGTYFDKLGHKYKESVICVMRGKDDEGFPRCNHVVDKKSVGWENGTRLSVMDPCNEANDIAKGSSVIQEICCGMNRVHSDLEKVYADRRIQWKEWESTNRQMYPQAWISGERGKLDKGKLSGLKTLMRFTSEHLEYRMNLKELDKSNFIEALIVYRGGYRTPTRHSAGSMIATIGARSPDSSAVPSSSSRKKRDRSESRTSDKRQHNTLEGGIMLDERDVGATGANEIFDTSSEEDHVGPTGPAGPSRKRAKVNGADLPKPPAYTSSQGGVVKAKGGEGGVQVIHQSETGDPSLAGKKGKGRSPEEKQEIRIRQQRNNDFWSSKGGSRSSSPITGISKNAHFHSSRDKRSGGSSTPIEIDGAGDDANMGGTSEDEFLSAEESRGNERSDRIIVEVDHNQAIQNQEDFIPL